VCFLVLSKFWAEILYQLKSQGRVEYVPSFSSGFSWRKKSVHRKHKDMVDPTDWAYNFLCQSVIKAQAAVSFWKSSGLMLKKIKLTVLFLTILF